MTNLINVKYDRYQSLSTSLGETQFILYLFPRKQFTQIALLISNVYFCTSISFVYKIKMYVDI